MEILERPSANHKKTFLFLQTYSFSKLKQPHVRKPSWYKIQRQHLTCMFCLFMFCLFLFCWKIWWETTRMHTGNGWLDAGRYPELARQQLVSLKKLKRKNNLLKFLSLFCKLLLTEIIGILGNHCIKSIDVSTYSEEFAKRKVLSYFIRVICLSKQKSRQTIALIDFYHYLGRHWFENWNCRKWGCARAHTNPIASAPIKPTRVAPFIGHSTLPNKQPEHIYFLPSLSLSLSLSFFLS